MSTLDLETFISAADDPEFSQYKVLAALKNYSEQLHKNKLYPPLGELVEIRGSLKGLLDNKENLRNTLPQRLIGFDITNQKPLYEKQEVTDKNLNKVFEFINWALPKINEEIDEGKAIYDFVDSNLLVKELGIMPIYKNEGYFIIPDHTEKKLQIYRFELSLLASSDIPFRSLKSTLIESVEDSELRVYPESIKLGLIKKYPDLPNPAIYSFQIEIEFPFDETILPIAKRKLMQKLAA